MDKKLHVHFMGIGGSAISGVALMAKKEGFEVSGCDLESETAYLNRVKDAKITVYKGHDKSHLKGVDILAVSPAILFLNKSHPEVVDAEKRKILTTWQAFLGRFLQRGKEVICIAGTHGKSTTSALTGLIFEKAGFDISVVVGAKVKEWGGNCRVGKGNLFITESDEFHDNFLNYSPDVIILNNIEFDHPDYFKSEKELIKSFENFISKLKGKRTLIVNQDSFGIKKLFINLDKGLLKKITIYGYTFFHTPILKIENVTKIKILKKKKEGTEFRLKSDILHLNDRYYLSIPGEYNVANASGVIILAKLYGIKNDILRAILKNFQGVGRRLELIGEKNGVLVYDDYAHHPTAIRETLKGLRQKHPKERIWAVVEPHSYSRTKALLSEYNGVFDAANKVIVGPIFKARDKEKFGVSSDSIVKASKHSDIKFISTIQQIVYKLKKDVRKGDVIIVMGAGKSYLWAREIFHII